jgi:plastocyanin
MRRRRSVAALATALALALGAVPTTHAATKTVYAGPPTERPPAGSPEGLNFNAFFRERVTVNVGDTVGWEFRGFHNVLFPGGEEEPALIVQDTSRPYSGFRDAAGAALWFNGQPSLAFNPVVAQPQGSSRFAGRGLRNSGLPLSDDARPYRLRFTRVGNYRYVCTVHPGMVGHVKVVSRRRSVPSPAADRQAAIPEMRRAVRRARRLAGYAPRGRRVVGGHDRGKVAFLRFFPQRERIRAGQSVEFSVDSRSEVHNVVFGPARYRRTHAGIERIPSGLGEPSLALNPLGLLPSDPPPALPPYDGRNHGNGFLGTGLLDTDPDSPNPRSSRVTFSRRGEYEFECTIHPGMIGRVVVR